MKQWKDLSLSQRYALRWAAMPAGTGGPRPTAPARPRTPDRTFLSLARHGLVQTAVFWWVATPEGRALIPAEPVEDEGAPT